MSAFKDICGEKAYIGNVTCGYTDLMLCGIYENPQEIYKKMLGSKIHKQYVNLGLCATEQNMYGVVNTSYEVSIKKVPINEALSLPDWDDKNEIL